jgi:SAM-dependent methyltransferase
MDTKQHYEKHLAEYYSEMFGSFDEKLKENKDFFESHNIKPEDSKTSIDLGAGSGFQSISLAKLGFNVIAVDFSRKLLDELNIRKQNLNIETVEADIMDFGKYSNHKPELIVCMGDTLTHLNSTEDVKNLFFNCKKILTENGKLILSFRDLNLELKGEDRFIPVRSDDRTIFTCFLEYEKEFVKVYDIIHKKINGKWSQNISSYKKLKLSLEEVTEYLNNIGFTSTFSETSEGLVYIIACK